MEEFPIADLVLVHLAEAGEALDDRTTGGICDALDIGASVSERIEVLSALSSLQERGLIEAESSSSGQRAYRLTADGETVATEHRQQFADRTVEIVESDQRYSCSLVGAREQLDVPSIATVLTRTVDGQVLVDDVPEETFVGRADELGSFDRALSAVEDGESRTIQVVGEQGVGKTELFRRVSRAPDRSATVVSITCRPDPTNAFESVREGLAEHGKAEVFDRQETHLDRMGALTERRTELFADIQRAIESIASSNPVLITVDDFYEAGAETAELIEMLASQLPAGVLLAVATRPTDRVDGMLPTELVDIELRLGPLDRDRTRELVVRLLGTRSVPESVTDRLYDRTGGTPLFVTGLLARLQETGAIDTVSGVYPTPEEPFPVSADSSAAIERRLAALDDPARAVLETAALIGHTVDPPVLAVVSDQPSSTVREYLELFARTGLFESAEPPRFQSELIRELVLESIPQSEQRRRHEAIARAYEAAIDDPSHATIAAHYEQAGQSEAAMQAYRTAGEQAMAVYANEAALSQYERALSLAREHDDRVALVEIVESMGRVYFVTGEYEEADRYFEYLREQTDDPERIQLSYRYQAEMAQARGELDRAESYAEAAIDAVDEPTRTSCRLLGILGWLEFRRGDLDTAQSWFDRQHDLARQLGDTDRLGGVYHNLGMIAYQRGAVEETIDYMERAVEANEESGAAVDALASYNNLSFAYDRSGRIDEAIDVLETARDRAAEIGERATEITAMGHLARYHHQRGALDRAEELADEVLIAAQQLEVSTAERLAAVTSGRVLVDRCAFDRARERFGRGLDREDDRNMRLDASARCGLALVELYEHEPAAARELLEPIVAGDAGIEPELRALIHHRLGDVERSIGDLSAAIDAYERSLEHATDCRNPRSQIQARFRLGVTKSEHTGGEDGIAIVERAVDDVAGFEAPLLGGLATIALARSHRFAGQYAVADDVLADAENILGTVDAPLLDCWLRTEQAHLATDRDTADGPRKLEAAADFADDHGVVMLARQCRGSLPDG